jgi:hypothetical protein
MNVEIGTDAVQFPEKEHIIVIFVAEHKFYLKRSHEYPSTGAPLDFFSLYLSCS